MKTVFDDNTGQLNAELFEPELLLQTNNLGTVLTAMSKTQSSRVESTHLLMALIRIPDGLTQKLFHDKGITWRELEEGLSNCVVPDPGFALPERLSLDLLDESAQNAIKALNGALQGDQVSRLGEGHLLLATLENLTPSVRDILTYVQLALPDLIDKVKADLVDEERYELPDPFDDSRVRLAAFSPGARRVLELAKTEAKALGYPQMDPRHLLLALLEFEGGATAAFYGGAAFASALMVVVTAHVARNREQFWNGDPYLF